MRLRPVLTVAVLAALLAVAGLGVLRSTADSGPTRAERVAASLRCPSCAGETVAQSRSPVAAAMREAISAQLAAGRSPDQVREWFAQRYGADVLAEPSNRGLGTLLWILPGIVLLAGLVLAVRTLRRRTGDPDRARAPSTRPGRARPAWTRRTWDLAAVGVVAMVALVAVGGTRSGGETAPPPAASGGEASPPQVGGTPSPTASGDAVTRQVNLAEALEQQGQYGAAVEIYRTAAAGDPDPQLRLRLAFALIRAGRPTEAADIARQVLAGQPSDADTLLVLGLAERATHSPAADQTFRRFLRVAPDHPASAQVRRLLGGE
jgi:cytochrome c-type biogenesis protein CcmH/NrfF